MWALRSIELQLLILSSVAKTDDKNLKISINNTVIIPIPDESGIQMTCSIVKKLKTRHSGSVFKWLLEIWTKMHELVIELKCPVFKADA